MNDYVCTFNYYGETSEMKTKAMNHYQAILNCLSVMAKKYGVNKDSLIRYFSADKLNHEVRKVNNKKLCDNCKFWKETGLGHFGTCQIKAETTKWSATCRKHIKEVTNANL